MKISGQTVLITGGTSGIGLALAKMFVESGNRVIVVGRDPRKLETVEASHELISTVQCDLGRQDELEKLLLIVQRDYPNVTVLINNAGLQHNYYLTETSLPYQRIENEIDVNFTAVVKLSTMLLPLLSTKAEAAIVNVSSGLAFAPKENAAVYCATKAAVHNFTTVLRYQLEKTSIKVFELIPPLVETAMTAGRGAGKITPETVAGEFKAAWLKDRVEVNVGKIKLMRVMLRWVPGFITNKLRYST
ncbi:MAG: SDR family NAD(P)-dependent oxidoreductase [Calditrichaeota bacterium]|nr:SDR family NAD(P)-dependent oxidoreductase [Calditrichota bacterium]